MAEISNNLIASLLIVAIIISAFGVLSLIQITPVTITGRALEYGTANVTITGAVAIEMLRNVTDFGSSTLQGAYRNVSSQTDNSFSNTLAFNNGSEGNGTDYGSGAFAYPFVVENIGNVNVSINISADAEASSWIAGTVGPAAFYKGANNFSNGNIATCGINFTSTAGYGEDAAWNDLNATESEVCASMVYSESEDLSANEMRIHFRISIPTDAIGTKGSIITLGALQSPYQ